MLEILSSFFEYTLEGVFSFTTLYSILTGILIAGLISVSSALFKQLKGNVDVIDRPVSSSKSSTFTYLGLIVAFIIIYVILDTALPVKIDPHGLFFILSMSSLVLIFSITAMLKYRSVDRFGTETNTVRLYGIVSFLSLGGLCLIYFLT